MVILANSYYFCGNKPHLYIMHTQEVKTNSIQAWWLASRPKTLSAALVPVVVAAALAWKDERFSTNLTLLCMLFAILMQIAANFINDLFDFKRGSDRTDRLGPERACAQGWITPHAMQRGIIVTLLAACATGLLLLGLSYAGAELLFVGAACVIFAFLYTTLLSYCGLGDVLVWLFFGFVPVLGTYFVQAHHLTAASWIVATGCGLAIDNLLIVNNYRDRQADKLSGKRTLVVVFGEQFGSYFYLIQGALAYVCCAALGLMSSQMRWCMILPLAYLAWHTMAWRRMVKINNGRKLNKILGQTSRNILLFGVMLALSILLG